MCADDYCDVYNETKRKARKEHTCCACDETIERGHHYMVIGTLYDGSWETFKQCMRCHAMMVGIYQHTHEPVALRLDCNAGPFEPGEVPDLEYLAFVTAEEMQS